MKQLFRLVWLMIFGIYIFWIRKNIKKIAKQYLVIFYIIFHISVCEEKRMQKIYRKHGLQAVNYMNSVSVKQMSIFGKIAHVVQNVGEEVKMM